MVVNIQGVVDAVHKLFQTPVGYVNNALHNSFSGNELLIVLAASIMLGWWFTNHYLKPSLKWILIHTLIVFMALLWLGIGA